jgi:hypothetical protein
MAQIWDQVATNLYRVAPGEDRHYVFALVDMAYLHEPQRFLTHADSSHVLLVPLCPAGTPYLLSKHAVLSASQSYVLHVSRKTGLDSHTCATIILAAGWLIQYPDDTSGASRRARLAPALLAGRDVQQEAWGRLEEFRATLPRHHPPGCWHLSSHWRCAVDLVGRTANAIEEMQEALAAEYNSHKTTDYPGLLMDAADELEAVLVEARARPPRKEECCATL